MKQNILLLMIFMSSWAGCSQSAKKEDSGDPKIEAFPMKNGCSGIAEPKKDVLKFGELDVDKDLKISRLEYLCQKTAGFSSLDKDKNHFITVKEMGSAKLNDKNKDGKISISEFVASKAQGFDVADKDKDSSLNRSEFGSSQGAL